MPADHLVQHKHFVAIALWRYEQDRYVCYRILRVSNPVFTKFWYSKSRELEKFLHAGETRELFYFTQTKQPNGTKDINCHIFDLEKAMNAQDYELERMTVSMFRAPYLEKFSFEPGSDIYTPLSCLLFDRQRTYQTADLRMYTFSDKKYLVLTIPFSQVADGSAWIKTSYGGNVHFIDLAL